jgi:hypothetical protein
MTAEDIATAERQASEWRRTQPKTPAEFELGLIPNP